MRNLCKIQQKITRNLSRTRTKLFEFHAKFVRYRNEIRPKAFWNLFEIRLKPTKKSVNDLSWISLKSVKNSCKIQQESTWNISARCLKSLNSFQTQRLSAYFFLIYPELCEIHCKSEQICMKSEIYPKSVWNPLEIQPKLVQNTSILHQKSAWNPFEIHSNFVWKSSKMRSTNRSKFCQNLFRIHPTEGCPEPFLYLFET